MVSLEFFIDIILPALTLTGLLLALLSIVRRFLISILPLLPGIISEDGQLHFLTGEGYR
jgi:hypothetical protein